MIIWHILLIHKAQVINKGFNTRIRSGELWLKFGRSSHQ